MNEQKKHKTMRHTPLVLPLLAALLALASCTTRPATSPITRVDGGYIVNLEVNALDTALVNGKLIDLVVMDMEPLRSATSGADTAAFVAAVMNEDKHVEKVTGVARMDSPYSLKVTTGDVFHMDPTHEHVLIVDVHDSTNTAQHPNLRGTLGCGSCLLMNQFRLVYLSCLTGDRKRCPACISCDVLPRR